MPIPDSLNDREHQKFFDFNGVPTVRVVNRDGSLISAGGGGGTSMVDDSPFTPAGSSVTPVGFLADDTAPDPVDEGDVGAPRMNRATRIAYAELRDSAGTEQGTPANPLRVDPTGATTQPVSLASLPALPAGTNNIGDVDVLSLPALAAGTNRVGGVYQVNGQLIDDTGAVLTVKRKAAVVASSGVNAFISAVASKKIRVLAYRLQARGTVLVKFFDTQATPAQVTDSPEWDLQAREGAIATAPFGGFEFETASGQGLQVSLSAAISTMVHALYVEV